MNYYEEELSKLKDMTWVSVSLTDYEGNKTKHLMLNQESIPSIINFLNQVLEIRKALPLEEKS